MQTKFIKRHGAHGSPITQRGIALFVGMVFLVILSLVAVIAMRGTLLEMRMVNNVASHERAFEVSESLRAVPLALFDDHTFNRGWPTSMGGTVPNTNFGTFPQCGSKDLGSSGVSCNVLKAVTIRSTGTGLLNLYETQFLTGEKAYDTNTWSPTMSDLQIVAPCDESGACNNGGSANIWIRPDGTAITAGSGAAQAAGYRGIGNSSASGGSSMFFEVLSKSTANSSHATTLSQYRQRISN